MILRGRQHDIALRRLRAGQNAFLAHMQNVRSIAFIPVYQYTWRQRIIAPANYRIPGADRDGWSKPKTVVVVHEQIGSTPGSVDAWHK